jgi:hypothetical protein
MGYGGGFGLGTIVYLVIGAFVAGVRDYFDGLSAFPEYLSALLAILLWPLLLLGIDLEIR